MLDKNVKIPKDKPEINETSLRMSKMHHIMELPENRFEFTPEEKAKVEEVWDFTKRHLEDLELVSRYVRWVFQKIPTYVARPDLSKHNSHVGYVYAIKDPRILSDKNIIFVGSSNEPWIAVERHMKRSQNKVLREYVKGMLKELKPKSYVFWRQKEIVVAWHDNVEIEESPLTREGGIEIPWIVLGQYMEPEEYEQEVHKAVRSGISLEDLEPNWSRNEWVEYLVDQGHPVLNGRPGRKGLEYPWLRKEDEE